MSTETQDLARGKRIEANCKKIWGANKDFDFDVESDDYEFYFCYVREDFGDMFGRLLAATFSYRGLEGAWNELDRMLRHMARHVEQGESTTKNIGRLAMSKKT
ncbi:hypothetical protein BDV96DRAFT_405626 [Lophiotrema nucula]|uniref:Uncharacterized protein n=1 Tax=Lophiotrema nucula TaxID=690887 RepID=A0A6A5ZG20_9PLEO|nr:hypothetical protein BDV96DRAFT_405626 [Lophiotrema nucula]